MFLLSVTFFAVMTVAVECVIPKTMDLMITESSPITYLFDGAAAESSPSQIVTIRTTLRSGRSMDGRYHHCPPVRCFGPAGAWPCSSVGRAPGT